MTTKCAVLYSNTLLIFVNSGVLSKKSNLFTKIVNLLSCIVDDFLLVRGHAILQDARWYWFFMLAGLVFFLDFVA